MALITCPDCGRDVSDRAPRCPECGRPMGLMGYPGPEASHGIRSAPADRVRPAAAPPGHQPPKRKSSWPAISVIVVMVLGVLLADRSEPRDDLPAAPAAEPVAPTSGIGELKQGFLVCGSIAAVKQAGDLLAAQEADAFVAYLNDPVNACSESETGRTVTVEAGDGMAFRRIRYKGEARKYYVRAAALISK
jgi:hypothetical protein